jgi:hypothetical protein
MQFSLLRNSQFTIPLDKCSDEANIGSRGGRALPRLEGEALKKGFLEEVISQDLAEW